MMARPGTRLRTVKRAINWTDRAVRLLSSPMEKVTSCAYAAQGASSAKPSAAAHILNVPGNIIR